MYITPLLETPSNYSQIQAIYHETQKKAVNSFSHIESLVGRPSSKDEFIFFSFLNIHGR